MGGSFTSSEKIEFPQGFKWGVSQSGFQFEMGDAYRRFIDTNTDWWHWVRDPYNISARLVSGDLPEDGINYAELYRRDHEIAYRLGLNTYRIGIEWSRIFPHPTWFVEVDVEYDGNGLIKSVKITEDTLRELDKLASQSALRFYRDIITDLRRLGFKVIVNLYHFTIPYWLHNPLRARETGLRKGPLGLLEHSFPVEFAKYAAYMAWKLSDIVDFWSTINEPMVPAELGYLWPQSGFPPGVNAPQSFPKAVTNLILAHSLAYDMVKKFDTVKADQDSDKAAHVGIIYNIVPVYGLSEGDEEAAEHHSYLHNDAFLTAITSGKLDLNLDQTTIVKPPLLGGRKLDWIGVNYYTRAVVKRLEPMHGNKIMDFATVPGYGYACNPYGFSKIGRWCSAMGWEHYPEGLEKAVLIARKYCENIYITENGISDPHDIYRPAYIVNHVYVLHKLIENGVSVKGYLHWALLDNYEWAHGFRQRFGLYEVDLTTKERKPRPSAMIYKSIAESNSIPKEYLKYLIEMKWDRA
ncbi:beta-galactosidase BgaS [Staphylothermus hellenicus]|uniref:Glycoside hydrolase family 1 n=1 Tax=Staphylothermus hellenicus (strain DSM 12710 / JCM 10830 / BK20S6-10-b1 / P8) TaxID=591019 RepID=D7D821_STAHD|nr:beta-galactosidase BgaS [Staphylothermus hellenicus]ADI31917.1 glycoside hydrolase family 1 [Staphylothermus hellenicus DSM 12710]